MREHPNRGFYAPETVAFSHHWYCWDKNWEEGTHITADQFGYAHFLLRYGGMHAGPLAGPHDTGVYLSNNKAYLFNGCIVNAMERKEPADERTEYDVPEFRITVFGNTPEVLHATAEMLKLPLEGILAVHTD